MANAANKRSENKDNDTSSKQIRKNQKEMLEYAVQDDKPISKRGLLDRLFKMAFTGFVYPQIWEDPEVDLTALNLDKNSRIMTIASGGCNVMNYLTESPEAVKAIDLNPAHVALTRLKIAALKHLPDYESFFLFFAHANDKRNIENYDKFIAPNLDPFTRKYWDGWSLGRGRRINYFTKNLYQFGLLGRSISIIHFLSGIYGIRLDNILKAQTMEEQREIFNRDFAPFFEKPFVKRLCNMPISLYGLGIPPNQFDELVKDADGDMAQLLKQRTERLACDFPIQENYFAWQAFGRGYDLKNKKALPRYLHEKHYNKMKDLTDRVSVHNTTITGYLESQPGESLDCYVFLDAQDWMNKKQLDELWTEVLRTARPGARVIFRTAGTDSPLTTKLKQEIQDKFSYNPAESEKAVAKDRSSIYGGFHVYILGGEVAEKKTKKTRSKKAA